MTVKHQKHTNTTQTKSYLITDSLPYQALQVFHEIFSESSCILFLPPSPYMEIRMNCQWCCDDHDND